ncbi:serine hydrolase domain-containing protein [Oryzobacter telluris]|uniref:serine hydrolase domain-containing protein n=1 Tax=Oryzobacter telluris TaxID=3149179 RepID=UPI00370D3F76
MDLERLTAQLTEGCERFGVPGAQVGLLRGDERVVACVGSVGVDQGSAAVEPATAFHAGSIAKSLAALLVVDAARHGLLDLDLPCSDQAEGLWSDTPRALMSHTTGRQNVLPDLGEDIVAFVDRVGSMPPVHEPGRFSYGNANWSVLDLLLRRRAGGSFEELAVTALGDGTTFGMPGGAALGHVAMPGQAVSTVPSEYAEAASAAGSRWWATADQLLDYAAVHLGDGDRFHPDDVRELRRPHVAVPGATISDAWGLGWALWSRGEHSAFGWAGYTGGHRAFLRCFPDQDAALVVLANSAGPLLGPPGGSALFDALLPDLLTVLGVPALPGADRPRSGRPTSELAGSYGPVALAADGEDDLLLEAAAFGEPQPIRHERVGGDTFVAQGVPVGGMPIAVDADLLYLGPFAVPRQ